MTQIMVPLRTAKVLDVDVDLLTLPDAVTMVAQAAREKRQLSCSLVGMHTISRARRDAAVRSRLNFIDVKIIDSMPACLFLRMSGHQAQRIRGQDFFTALCEYCADNDLSLFFFGTNEATLNAVSERLLIKFPRLKIAGTKPGRYRLITAEELQEDIDAIVASNADIVMAGLGSPNQDIWVYEMTGILSRPLIAIGAAFDFEAGTRVTAPKWMQNTGMEWLFRFASEPRRLWKRYLLEAPAFVIELIKDSSGISKPAARDSKPPEDRYHFG